MKNRPLSRLFIAFLAVALSACSGSSGGGSNGIYVPSIDNSADLKQYEGEDYKVGDEKYYVSDYISFIMSVKGYYQTDIPFVLDKDNENLRIYDDIYFYEGDYFQLMSSDYHHVWATLKNENTPYLSPLREQGEDIQVDVKKSGIYKIVLDIKTMIMDFDYKSEIKTPYYYPFKGCEIGTLIDGKGDYKEMIANPDNADEFFIEDYAVEAGKLYSFYSRYTHTSTYKLTIEENSKQYVSETMFDTSVTFNISGDFDIYVNRKTYEIRAVPSDPSSLVYDCLTYSDGVFITLSPKDPAVPYLFEYEYEATSDVGGYGVVSDDLPKFYSKSYKEYALTVAPSDLLGGKEGKYYFKKKGHYLLTIDLLNLTLEVEKAQE